MNDSLDIFLCILKGRPLQFVQHGSDTAKVLLIMQAWIPSVPVQPQLPCVAGSSVVVFRVGVTTRRQPESIWRWYWSYHLHMTMSSPSNQYHLHMTMSPTSDNVGPVSLIPAHALHGGVSYFAFVCLSECVCVSVSKISQKILNQSTSFLVEAFPLPQGGNHSNDSMLKKFPLG